MQRCAVLAFIAVAVAGCGASRPASEASFEVVAPRAAAPASPAPAGVVVYVAGAVQHPGVYRLGAGRRVADALHLAGDAKPDADLLAVNLAEPLRDGEEIAVPARGEHLASPARAGAAPAQRARRGATRPAADAAASAPRSRPRRSI